MQIRTQAVALVFLLLAGTSAAIADDAVPTFQAVRTTARLTIDGRLDEAAWALAPEITEFVQSQPNEGAAPAERTVARLLYDDEALYVAARIYQSTPLVALLARRDTDLETDVFRIDIDSLHDHRTGWAFRVNPVNNQRDLSLFNDISADDTWDAVWTSATQVLPDGWSAEFRIPFAQLRFPPGEEQLWGINLARYTSRTKEIDQLARIHKGGSGYVSRFPHLGGIRGVKPQRPLEVVPYTRASLNRDTAVVTGDPLNERSQHRAAAGLDVRYGITSNMTLSGTINPDFGQVELDPAQVNLSAFELFLPEKRPFFLEGASLFSFGRGNNSWPLSGVVATPQFFYSRRLGREPQGTGRLDSDFLSAPNETTILGAAKLTGKTASGWSVGVLDAVTSSEKARTMTNGVFDTHVVEPGTNYFVSRLARDFGSSRSLGVLFTAVDRSLPDELSFLRSKAYTFATDGSMFLGNRDVVIEGFAGASLVQGSPEAIAATQLAPAHYYQRPDSGLRFDPTRTSLSGFGARAVIAKQTGKWRYQVDAQSYSPGFEVNDAGFLARGDITSLHTAARWFDTQPTRWFQDRMVSFERFAAWNGAGNRIRDGEWLEATFTTKNYWTLFAATQHDYEQLDDRSSRGGPLLEQGTAWHGEWSVTTDSRNRLVGSVLQRYWHRENGAFDRGISFNLAYQPAPFLKVSVGPNWSTSREYAHYVAEQPDAAATATFGKRWVFGRVTQRQFQIATRLEWTFTPTLSLQLYAQPFVAAAKYDDMKELLRPASRDYLTYDSNGSTIVRDGSGFVVDPDGATGSADPFRFADPSFDVRSGRGSAVVRWEFHPGSALFVTWTNERSAFGDSGDFHLREGIGGIGNARGEGVFLVKMTYLIPFAIR